MPSASYSYSADYFDNLPTHSVLAVAMDYDSVRREKEMKTMNFQSLLSDHKGCARSMG